MVTLGLALKADEISSLVNILAEQASLSGPLQEIRSELVQRREVETRIHLDQERRNVSGWCGYSMFWVGIFAKGFGRLPFSLLLPVRFLWRRSCEGSRNTD